MHLALSVSESGDDMKQDLVYLTIAGFTIAVISIGLSLEAQTTPPNDFNKKMAELRKQMRFTLTALETYRIDTNHYPAYTTDPQWSHGAGSIPADVPTFRRGGIDSGKFTVMSLTTPVSYLSKISPDPFSPTSAPLAYVSFPKAWLLWSAGPDGKYDMDWKEFNPDVASQSPDFFAAYSYDASNGVVSAGDIWYSQTNVAPSRNELGSIDLAEPDPDAAERGTLHLMKSMMKATKSGKPPQNADKAVEVRNQLRFYETALESYLIDNNKYPPHTADPAVKHGGEKMPESVPTFKRYEPNIAFSLTTPLAYLSNFPADPYAADDSPFAYVSFDTKWLLWSPGPDGKYDLDWTEFDPEAAQQSPDFFAKYSYDVTNGVNSTGDLWLSRGRVGSVTFP
jgi:type II secretory pathway pseudopilin PulG